METILTALEWGMGLGFVGCMFALFLLVRISLTADYTVADKIFEPVSVFSVALFVSSFFLYFGYHYLRL